MTLINEYQDGRIDKEQLDDPVFKCAKRMKFDPKTTASIDISFRIFVFNKEEYYEVYKNIYDIPDMLSEFISQVKWNEDMQEHRENETQKLIKIMNNFGKDKGKMIHYHYHENGINLNVYDIVANPPLKNAIINIVTIYDEIVSRDNMKILKNIMIIY